MRHEEMASGEGVSCDEDTDMNFAFTTAGSGGAQFITTSSGQVAKLQQNVGANGTTLSQVVGMVGGVNMGDGVQYMRTLDGGATIHATPQLITLPIALPGAKPGDPQQTVQIQVLSPNITLQQQQQQPKYHMQIPIQGFQQGGAVLTLAYAPEGGEGMQLLNNQLPEGFQVVQIPQEMQIAQNQDTKDQLQQALQQQILAVQQQQQQLVLNNNSEEKSNHNLETEEIIIKEECHIEDDNGHDDDVSQGAENTNDSNWQNNSGQDLVNYFNRLPQQLQQTQSLPVSLQQFLILNSNSSVERKSDEKPVIQIEITQEMLDNRAKDDDTEASSEGQGAEESPKTKRKKKYKKKSPKPAKPKPGQIVITTSNDGTVIYCCPECHMAYSEKEQLEMHLAVHKIERRFICGICGAGLKRKEHLERHKLGHNPERPYVCVVCRKGFKRREHLNLHTVIHTGVKTEICPDCGKGFYRKDHLRKHTRSHETRRAREDVIKVETTADDNQNNASTNEITIHVPTSSNIQVPIQINIPQHVVSSLTSQQGTQLTCNQQSQLDALLAQHT